MRRVSLPIFFLFIGSVILWAQAPNELDSILVYKGETPGSGPGVSVLNFL